MPILDHLLLLLSIREESLPRARVRSQGLHNLCKIAFLSVIINLLMAYGRPLLATGPPTTTIYITRDK